VLNGTVGDKEWGFPLFIYQNSPMLLKANDAKKLVRICWRLISLANNYRQGFYVDRSKYQ